MKTTCSIQSLALALNVEGETAPDWIQLTPTGPEITGRDGRTWQMRNPDTVVAAFRANGADLPVDFEHATQVKGEKGEPAPAIGWIKDLENRDGAIWGQVAWNAEGQQAVASKGYRYVSPVFNFTRTANHIVKMVSAGLTNQPNLQLAALNKETAQEEAAMTPEIRAALGLAEGASNDDALTAINKLKTNEATARNRADNPDTSSLVPKADYELAMNRIRGFEDADKTRTDEAVTAAVDAAVEAGKIAPASRDYHTASCRVEGGLALFNAMVDASAVIAPKSELDGKDPNKKADTLSAEETAICRQMGISKAEFLATKNEDEV